MIDVSDKEFEGLSWAKMVERQERNPTMDKPLFITVCPTGALFSRKQNPNLPYSPKEIATATIESYAEGASLAHLHTRDEYGESVSNTKLLTETIAPILDECPDMIIQPSSAEGYNPQSGEYSYETVAPMVEALQGIDKRYIQSTIFTPISYYLDGSICLATEDNAVKTVSYLESRGIKPEFMAHDGEGLSNVREWLIKPGLLKKPYSISLGPGMHNSAETYPDPWGMLYLLGLTKMVPPDSVVGVSIGGRNWLPMTTFAILLGVDFVRVGMEDHLWMYPQRDEKITSNAEAVRKIATIARELGRDVGSAAQARTLLGIQ
ncbi:MAG: 3-keto-5-aminohexanoate cleavage protein [Thermoplasmata archaeon]|nr:3-keto-5-aminohexanoate cleavage protein [Thermoplasmata archaeon]